MQKLRSQGYACVVYDLNDTADRPVDVDFVQGDIRDFAAVTQVSRDVEVVYHNVAQVPLAKNKSLFESVNVQGTRNMLEAALRASVRKVIYTSSSAVFGIPKINPVTEATPPSPEEDYGRAKFRGELICRDYANKGLDVSIVRPRTIVGHGRLGIFHILFEWIRTGYNVPVLGRGDNLYQFVHADDLAEACILAAARPGPATYNCGTDRFGTMREALEALCAYAHTGSKVTNVPMLPAELGMKFTGALGLSPLGDYHALMYGRSFYFNIERAKSELGWQPKYSNDEMFVESYQWYLDNLDKMGANSVESHHRSSVKEGILKIVKLFF